MALTSAAAPYVAWLNSTAAQAAQIGTQAKAAAGLFETAYSATVPPPVIADNRALLLALISTNFFGQNTPAIAATEAQYEAMWAQDGATMDTYSGASQTNAAALQQPSPAPPVAKSLAASNPAPTTATGNLLTDLETGLGSGNFTALANDLGLGSLLGSTGTTATGTGASSLGDLQLIYYPALIATLPLRVLLGLLIQLGTAAARGGLVGSTSGAAGGGTLASSETLMNQIGEFVDGKLGGAVGTLVGHFNTATQAISAKLGQEASMGSLKVPQGWSMAAEGLARAAPVLPHTTASAPVQTMSGTSGLPGGPFGNAMLGAMAGRGMGAVAAKAPKVVPRSPAGG